MLTSGDGSDADAECKQTLSQCRRNNLIKFNLLLLAPQIAHSTVCSGTKNDFSSASNRF